MSNDRIAFRIDAAIGTIAKYQNGWTKEINLVSWNNGPTKFDIRDWYKDHERMSKGITLTADEMRNLLESVQARDAVNLLNSISKSAKDRDLER